MADEEGRPLPSLRLGPNAPGTFLHRKIVQGGNPYFTPFEANVQGINLPEVQALRGSANATVPSTLE